MLVAPLSADVINGSFEDGLTGWTKSGGGLAFYTTDANGELDFENPVDYPFDVSTIPIYDGSWNIDAGGVAGANKLRIEHYGVPPELYEFEAPNGDTYWHSHTPPLWAGLYQDIQLAAGETLSGWAAFDTEEYIPTFRDFTQVTVNGEVIWHKHISDILVYDPGLDLWIVPEVVWEQWSFLAPTNGIYRLQFELHTDDQEYSRAFFDDVRVNGGSAGVPDATSTAALLGLVFTGFGLIARRRISGAWARPTLNLPCARGAQCPPGLRRFPRA